MLRRPGALVNQLRIEPLASLESPQAQPCSAGPAAPRWGERAPYRWEQLEEPARLAIEARTGRVHAARTADAGLNSQLAVVLDTDAGTVFVNACAWITLGWFGRGERR